MCLRKSTQQIYEVSEQQVKHIKNPFAHVASHQMQQATSGKTARSSRAFVESKATNPSHSQHSYEHLSNRSLSWPIHRVTVRAGIRLRSCRIRLRTCCSCLTARQPLQLELDPLHLALVILKIFHQPSKIPNNQWHVNQDC